ncbi:MAG TPA: twin-arginine translocase TatA/TatE family subunit [Planctomycetota bacterium]|jgi:sec-independent protein translocase protein TatA|nr:twin-arginine translocase TatA/TatE family subunit [Planctomycetota bacterium]
MTNLLALGGLSPMELIIIVGVIVLLFGSSKIPQLMRGVGSGINEFKKGLREGEQQAAADAAKPADVPKPAEAVKPAEPEKK